jgi:hypothetical protein
VPAPIASVGTDDDSTTILVTSRKKRKASKKQIPALLSAPPPQPDAPTAAPALPTMIFSGARKEPSLLQKPVSTPPAQPDALTAASTLQTVILSGIPKEPGLLQKPISTPPPQPDALTAASTLPTMIFSGKGAGLIEPRISSSPGASTVQNEPAPSPSFLERDDRIVVDPPYPRSSTVPTQHIREGIPPAVFGIAAIVLIVFLAGLLWWNFNPGKTDHFTEEAETALPTPSFEPLQDTDPILTFSTPPPPEENIPTPFDQELASESGPELMSIPSLPTNQQQGRHNQHNLPEIMDDNPSSPRQPPAPVSSTPARERAAAATAKPDEMPTPVEEAAYPRADAPAPAPVVIDSHTTAAPHWLGQMRMELANCPDLFCRERVRARYCTSQWENLSECRGISL